jgi:hypothetical protein
MSSAFTPSVGISNATTTVAGAVKLPSGEVRLHTGTGFGSTNTSIFRFTTTISNTGSSITYADSATLGASFTIAEAGVYAISMVTANSGAGIFGISKNSTELSTAPHAISTVADMLITSESSGGQHIMTAVTVPLAVGDVIRPHLTAGATTGSSRSRFTISQVYKF